MCSYISPPSRRRDDSVPLQWVGSFFYAVLPPASDVLFGDDSLTAIFEPSIPVETDDVGIEPLFLTLKQVGADNS